MTRTAPEWTNENTARFALRLKVRSGNDPLRLNLEGRFGAESLAQADLACKVDVAH